MEPKARWRAFRRRIARNSWTLPVLVAVAVAGGAAAGQDDADPEEEITLEEGIEALIGELDLDQDRERMAESFVTGLCKKTVVAKWSVYGKRGKEMNARLWLVGGGGSRERGQSAEITVTLINPQCPGEGSAVPTSD